MSFERLSPHATFTEERIAQIREVVPEAFADGKVNWSVLRETLGDWIEETGEDKEYFGLTWPGKRDARRLAAMPSQGTLVPVPGEGIDEDATRNLFIEGENLEVLKLLKKSYAGRVKMIYIDPPYNTGNDFIYEDDFAEPIETYLRRTGQLDQEGRPMTTNTRADGRFHSKWLSMMYPRLRLARMLLREDGILFVSIDDNEVHHLRQTLNEIFGEENFLAQLVWDLGTGTAAGHFTRAHEYVLVFARRKSARPNFPYRGEADIISDRAIKRISAANPASEITFPAGIDFEGSDAVFKGEFGDSEKVRVVSEKMVFRAGKLAQPVTLEAGWAMRDQILRWLKGDATVDTKGQKVTRFFFDRQGRLQYEKERAFVNPQTVLRKVGSTKNGSADLVEILGSAVLDFPKPVSLLKLLVELATDEGDLVMDFFAGSGTTAQAVVELNAKDQLRRRFLLVQMPEPIDDGPFSSIAEIAKERLRRVLAKRRKETPRGSVEDLGFRVLRFERSNYRAWADFEGENLNTLIDLFAKAESTLVDNWTPEGLLTEVMLLEGFPLDSTITSLDGGNGNKMVQVTSGYCAHKLFLCFDERIEADALDVGGVEATDVFVCLDRALTDETKIRLADQCLLKAI